MFTPELIEKGKHAKTPEELTKIAAENGVTLNGQEAIDAFNRLHPSKTALTPDDLDDAMGGCGSEDASNSEKYKNKKCPRCGSTHSGKGGPDAIQCADCGWTWSE